MEFRPFRQHKSGTPVKLLEAAREVKSDNQGFSAINPPFLDHRLLAYEFALPQEDRIFSGTSKAILRRATDRLLPDTVRLASKRSVQTPQREWFRNELREWVRDRINVPSFWNRGWIDRRKAINAMESFFRGEGQNSFFLWQWINLELWAQHYLAN